MGGGRGNLFFTTGVRGGEGKTGGRTQACLQKKKGGRGTSRHDLSSGSIKMLGGGGEPRLEKKGDPLEEQ